MCVSKSKKGSGREERKALNKRNYWQQQTRKNILLTGSNKIVQLSHLKRKRTDKKVKSSIEKRERKKKKGAREREKEKKREEKNN